MLENVVRCAISQTVDGEALADRPGDEYERASPVPVLSQPPEPLSPFHDGRLKSLTIRSNSRWLSSARNSISEEMRTISVSIPESSRVSANNSASFVLSSRCRICSELFRSFCYLCNDEWDTPRTLIGGFRVYINEIFSAGKVWHNPVCAQVCSLTVASTGSEGFRSGHSIS